MAQPSKPLKQEGDMSLVRQHKRMAMGLPVNQPVPGKPTAKTPA